jgi:hypothetical protein
LSTNSKQIKQRPIEKPLDDYQSENVKRNISIESECVVENLDFPTNIDHAWLFLAAGIHERLYMRTASDRLVPRVVRHFHRFSEHEFILRIDKRYRWTDSRSIGASEVASALARGITLGLFKAVDVIGNDAIKVRAMSNCTVDEDLLASPLFTITPSCRNPGRPIATCGPYRLASCRQDKRMVVFQKRNDLPLPSNAPETVRILVTNDREHGLSLIQSGHLTLSCPMGACPAAFRYYEAVNTVVNRATNMAMILRTYPDCWLANSHPALNLIDSVLDRHMLAEVSGRTFIPLTTLSALFETFEPSDDTRPPQVRHTQDRSSTAHRALMRLQSEPIEIGYADFHPNRQIANEIKRQLRASLSIDCKIIPRPYDRYISSDFPKRTGLSLEIVQPLSPRNVFLSNLTEAMSSDVSAHPSPGAFGDTERPIVIPILRATTTQISLSPTYSNHRHLTMEATIDWLRL